MVEKSQDGINRNVALAKLLDRININSDLSTTKVESIKFVGQDGDKYTFDVQYE